ncbi:hypothetical protein B0H14DRAFT_3600714 [Mycena olivaceomarginata]|nr:hypothetical protein B0H14DRAFT_3600714 [Mycena olivaceomarginata]
MLLRSIPVLLLHLSLYLRLGAASASCSCSSVVVPVHVDVLVPKDPTDVFGGLKSNETSQRRVNTTYDIYGVFCQPNAGNEDVLQLLAHGGSYTSQYWSPPIEEFRNYSYSAFSSRPANASDVQYPTSAAALLATRTAPQNRLHPPRRQTIPKDHWNRAQPRLRPFQLRRHRRRRTITLRRHGLTSILIFGPDDPPAGSGTSSIPIVARDADPLRWGALDPAYVTVNNRTAFYPADPTAYSPRMLLFDGFTKDVMSPSLGEQGASSSIPAANYTGAVAKVVGAKDQVLCATGRCVDVEALTAAEQVVWPAAKSFEVLVLQGSGHDLNLDFRAGAAFETIFGLVTKFSK